MAAQHELDAGRQELDAARQELVAARAEIDARDRRIAALCASTSWRVTAPLRVLGRAAREWRDSRVAGSLDLARIARQSLATEPYGWAFIDGLFSRRDAAKLVDTFPRTHFKTVTGYDGEKGYEYESRSLVHMGAHATTDAESLSPVWRRLATALVSPAYRSAMTRLTGFDLTAVPIEINLFHYGPGAWLGPHLDLKDKIVSHVLYFNDTWDPRDGGRLRILRSSDISDVAAEIAPMVGHSVVLVRSEKSWHAVSRVREGCRRSRCSMTVTFYHPGSASTMWPPGDTTSLHDYPGA